MGPLLVCPLVLFFIFCIFFHILSLSFFFYQFLLFFQFLSFSFIFFHFLFIFVNIFFHFLSFFIHFLSFSSYFFHFLCSFYKYFMKNQAVAEIHAGMNFACEPHSVVHDVRREGKHVSSKTTMSQRKLSSLLWTPWYRGASEMSMSCCMCEPMETAQSLW